jgi:hypothetical protein
VVFFWKTTLFFGFEKVVFFWKTTLFLGRIAFWADLVVAAAAIEAVGHFPTFDAMISCGRLEDIGAKLCNIKHVQDEVG